MDRCDFCYSPHVVKRFQCMDFDSESSKAGVLGFDPTKNDVIDVVLASQDFWAACAPCAELVEAENVDALVKRALAEFEKQEGRPMNNRAPFTAHMTRTYRLFFQNRIRVRA